MTKKRKRPLSKLRIIVEDNVAQVAWQRDSFTELRFAPPVDLKYTEPVDMQWYLERFFLNPTPLAQKKSIRAKKEMHYWGKKLFENLFDNADSKLGATLFHNAIAGGLDKCELAIVSDDQGALNMPWELMCSPQHEYLAPQMAGFYRSLNHHAIHRPLSCAINNCLNILLIICRRETKLESLAPYVFPRPLLKTLKPFIIKKQVMLKVLRPPTFVELERELSNNRGLYEIVHFDGHGVPGSLLFKRADGGEDFVSGERMAQILRNARVPMFLLSSCSSGVVQRHVHVPVGSLPSGVKLVSSISDVAKETISSVATQLLGLGASAVVGMLYDALSYPLRDFMVRLYSELLRGSTIAAAVAAGRRSLIAQPWRVTGTGNVYIEDWMIPVLFQQVDCTPLVRVINRKSCATSMSTTLAESKWEQGMLAGVPKAGRTEFIGRGFEMLELETLFQYSNVVVIQGLKGQGKTELACEYARWLAWTRGRKRAFFTSFSDGCGLHRTLRIIVQCYAGSRALDDDFESQRKTATQYLRKYPCLLIWDGFEKVEKSAKHSRKSGRTKEREDISKFLRDLRYGKTWVLITCRNSVRWLECKHRHFNLKGLRELDAMGFAVEVLNEIGHPWDPRDKDLPRLLKSLGRNPLAMRQELPKLLKISTKDLLKDVRNRLQKNNGTLYVNF